MPTTLPILTKRIDNNFLETWYEIRSDIADNVINERVVWAALKGAGCFKNQVGGELITRNIRYALPDSKGVIKGDTFSQGETETKTMAIWEWYYLSGHVQRSVFDDQTNAGKFKIRSYVADRIKDAKDSMSENYESSILGAFVLSEKKEDGRLIRGLNNLVPTVANRSSGEFGRIARPSAYDAAAAGVISKPTSTGTNPWWGPAYMQLLAPYEVNLTKNMLTMYNSLGMNKSGGYPDLLITTQSMHELYEEFAEEKTQIIRDETTRLANLGFSVLRYKGSPVIWSPNMATDHWLFLNTKCIEVVTDPNMWFSMSEFKPIALQGERIAHCLSACSVISDELKRHGRLSPDANE